MTLSRGAIVGYYFLCLEHSSSILAFHSLAVILHLANFLFFKAQFSVIFSYQTLSIRMQVRH